MMRGSDGLWVAGQFILLAAILVSPAAETVPGTLDSLRLVAGGILIVVGSVFALLGVVTLGDRLSAFPTPKPGISLVQTGVYGWVRHPIYTGVIAAALGWSLLRASPLGVVLSLSLILYFDRKAAYEEKKLTQTFPEYSDYQQRVRKLIPWLY